MGRRHPSSRSRRRRAARTTSPVFTKRPDCRHDRMRSSCSGVIETVMLLRAAMLGVCTVRRSLISHVFFAVAKPESGPSDRLQRVGSSPLHGQADLALALASVDRAGGLGRRWLARRVTFRWSRVRRRIADGRKRLVPWPGRVRMHDIPPFTAPGGGSEPQRATSPNVSAIVVRRRGPTLEKLTSVSTVVLASDAVRLSSGVTSWRWRGTVSAHVGVILGVAAATPDDGAGTARRWPRNIPDTSP